MTTLASIFAVSEISSIVSALPDTPDIASLKISMENLYEDASKEYHKLLFSLPDYEGDPNDAKVVQDVLEFSEAARNSMALQAFLDAVYCHYDENDAPPKLFWLCDAVSTLIDPELAKFFGNFWKES